MILPQSNLLIQTVKVVDPAVARIKILEYWQQLKLYGIPLGKYPRERKMELLRREVESATAIELKILP